VGDLNTYDLLTRKAKAKILKLSKIEVSNIFLSRDRVRRKNISIALKTSVADPDR
jgi:hypothetical protein